MFRDYVLAIIIRRWQQGERVIPVEVIADDLLQEGISIPEATLMKVLRTLMAHKLVAIPQRRNRKGHETPKDQVVNWVSSTLLT